MRREHSLMSWMRAPSVDLVSGQSLHAEALALEAERGLRVHVEAGRGALLLSRLVEVSPDEARSMEGEVLSDVVRGLRRLQPARRASLRFTRDAQEVRLGTARVFVAWSVFGGEPVERVHRYRPDQPGHDLSSWFADPRLWRAPMWDRMAAVFATPADPLPVLAFEPFPPGAIRPERFFRWSLVRADGTPEVRHG